MAGTMPSYLRDALANHVAKLATYTPPTTIYAALTKTAPTASAAGTELTSGTNTGYARVACTLASLFSESGGVLTTIADVLWPQNSGAGAWESATWVEFYDSSTSGGSNNRVLPWIVLGSAVACPAGEQVKMAAGAATVTGS